MSKERVQAKLAFNGLLKPVDSLKRAQTSEDAGKAASNGQQSRDDGENAPAKSMVEKKRKRGTLQQRCNISAGMGSASEQQAGPSAMQPPSHTAALEGREVKRSRASSIQRKCASENKSVEPNPVFALAARRCVVEANKSLRSRSALVDVTTPVPKTVPPDVPREACDISTSLPPVHVLQGFCFSDVQKIRHNSSQLSLCRPQRAAGSIVCEGSLLGHLQHESSINSVTTDVSKLLHDSIADFLWEDAAEAGAHGQEHSNTGCKEVHAQSDPSPADSPMTYLRTVLEYAGFREYAHENSSALRWQKQIAAMMGNTEDSSTGQLPWTAKYGPQAAEQLLSNSGVGAQLRQWLSRERVEKTGPTETESCAVSSWKADSEDSDFINSKPNRRCNGPGGMLLTGPHGSGKSAAVHACAQELHMNVLEISPGMDRSGTNLLKLVGEATQSHTVICKGMPLEEIDQPKQDDLTACKPEGKAAKKRAPKKKPARQRKPVKQRGTLQPEQRCLTGAVTNGALQSKVQSVTRSRSLLLFEDFDQLLENEDDGFMACLSTLLLESKIPVLLLSERPDAEGLLQRAVAAGAKLQSARLCVPPLRSLLEYLALVCACERTPVLPSALMQLACSCNGDLRSALNQLQFLADHCSVPQEGCIDIESPEGQMWKESTWVLRDMQLEVPTPLSALHRAQPWQAQPHGLVWGLREPQGSAARADCLSMSCSLTEWACSLLFESARRTGLMRHPAAGAELTEHGKQCEEDVQPQSAATMLQFSTRFSAPGSMCTGMVAEQKLESEGGRILAAWAEHLHAKNARSVKHRKQRRNNTVSEADPQPESKEVQKKCRVVPHSVADGEPAADVHASGEESSELHDDLLEDGTDEMQGRGVRMRVLDDNDAVGPCEMDVDALSESVPQLHDSAEVRQASGQAPGLVVIGDGDDALSEPLGGVGTGVSTIAPAGLQPIETLPSPDHVPVEGVSSLPLIASCGMSPGDERPETLNTAALVMKQADAAQKMYISHLYELAAEMQMRLSATHSNACAHVEENADGQESANAEAEPCNQPMPCDDPAPTQHLRQDQPVVASLDTMAGIQVMAQAAEVASSIEALSGRCGDLLDSSVDRLSTRGWLRDDVSAASSSTAAAAGGSARVATEPPAGSGAGTFCGGGTSASHDGVDAALLDAVLKGIHDSAFAWYTGRGHGAMREVVQCSVPFRWGLRLSGAHAVSALRPVLQCDTRSSVVHCTRAVITMAADECTAADEADTGARRSRRQRQRGHCAEMLHQLDFSLCQFSNAQLGDKVPV